MGRHFYHFDEKESHLGFLANRAEFQIALHPRERAKIWGHARQHGRDEGCGETVSVVAVPALEILPGLREYISNGGLTALQARLSLVLL